MTFGPNERARRIWRLEHLPVEPDSEEQTLDDLPAWCAQHQRRVPPEVKWEREYFASHRQHVHYQAMAARGCPVGSGAMESFCAQLQGRFKRCGQFWSEHGLADILALDVVRRNLDWDALWIKN